MPCAVAGSYTVESAQAALQLGPVQYVCNVCGQPHTSDEPPPRNCIAARVRLAGKSSWADDAMHALGAATAWLVAELCNVRRYAIVCMLQEGACDTRNVYNAVEDLITIVYPEAFIVFLLSSRPLLVTLAELKALPQASWLSIYMNSSWALMAEPHCVHREIIRVVRFHLRCVQWPAAADVYDDALRQAYDGFLVAIELFAGRCHGIE